MSDEVDVQDLPSEEVVVEPEGMTPQTQDARAMSKISLVIVEGGRQAWANFEYEDKALPGELTQELQYRVNEAAVNGAMDAADAARFAQRSIIENEKAAKESKA